MNPAKSPSVEHLQANGRFESLRKILTSQRYAEHLEKPLAYWALPTDRQLPRAFLGRTLDELLNTPFATLSRIPGIGQKKLASFVQLLARAANTNPAELPFEIAFLPKRGGPARSNGEAAGGNGHAPANVSELTWGQWRATVIRCGLEHEKLGRFAASLKSMTRALWNMPLGSYTAQTLHEIRSMRACGEKRVQAILGVFHGIHVMVGNTGARKHLAVRIVPRPINAVEQWVGAALQAAGVPAEEEIFSKFISPLLEQIHIDATKQTASVAEHRLGIACPKAGVRQIAKAMGLTRARVYQLFSEINDIMTVRWLLGRHLSYELCEKWEVEAAGAAKATKLRQFHAAIELFYPGGRRGAAGPPRQAEAMV